MKVKTCNNCKNEYKPKSNSAKFCSIDCRSEFSFKKRQGEILRGTEKIDYVIDLWNGFATPRIYGRWMNSMHPGKTTADYLKDFPGANLACDSDKKSTTKNAGQHMKLHKYRKMASDAMIGENNPNHKTNTTEEERTNRSPFSKKFKKYETAEDRKYFLESINWENRITSTQIEWWLNEGYSKEEAAKLYKERQSTFTLDKCIMKFGKKKGLERFNKRQEKWKKSLQENFAKYGDGRSPSSKFASSIIKEICNHFNLNIPEKEKWIKDKETLKAYSYDFTLKDKKKIIEFNGDYWHCNPKLYKETYYHKNKLMSAVEIWDYDKDKINTAKKYNYEVLVVWESDWNEYPKEVIKKCIEFLND